MDKNINETNLEDTINEKSKVSSENLYDLIQNIQSKFNVEETTKDDSKGNFSETADDKKIFNKKENKNVDFLKDLDISNLLGLLGSNSNKENNSTNSSNGFNLDPKLLLKMQKIITSFNKNDPRKDLLLSLKPFLRKSRQDKLSEYLTIMNVLDALKVFNDDEESDNNE
ncbi:MAG: hypothetical protein RSB67_03575 [Clostridia bacterium]